ncbi:MAG: type II toxin-antitoxin system RelE/ParE family toxin [Acidobacteria bacterium]|nr:type II toxin-antitoxin system RelE/ParE family toxin [Acidobacteriota bacterium]
MAPARATRWLTDLFGAIRTLADLPARCPMLPEAEELGRPLRHLVYGQRTGAYRIIFDIQEASEEGPRVRVLRIWHGARAPLRAEDIAPEE